MHQKPAYHFKKAPFHGFVVENNNYRTHLHRHVEITYVTKGVHLFTVENTLYELHAGDLVLVFPNQLHKLETPEYSKTITCIFDANLTSAYTDILNTHHITPCVFRKDELDETSLSALNELARTCISKSYKQHAVPYLEKGYISVILADLLNKRTLVPYKPTDSTFIITSFFNYIETHLNEDLSVDAIAKALSISPTKLSNEITYHTGKTLHSLVNTRRLDYSRHLLSETDMPISEITEICGFSSERTFYRNFKEMYNKTPLEFRQKKSIAKK